MRKLLLLVLVSACCDADVEEPAPDAAAPGVVFVCRGGGPEEHVCASGPALERLGWDCRPTTLLCSL